MHVVFDQRDHQATLEVYRHKDISVFFALFCPKCGSLFQLDVREMA